MLGRQLPSLTWNSANQLTIAYSGDNVKLDEVIPVAIADDGECRALLNIYICYFSILLFAIMTNSGSEYTLKAQTILS